MPNELKESLLGNPMETAELVTAHVGMSSILKGDTGIDYHPKSSPFSGIPRLSEKEPYTKAFPKESEKAASLDTLHKMKNKTSENIEKDAKSLFEGGEMSSPKENLSKFHELYDHSEKLNASPETLMNHLANQMSPISEHAPDTTIALSSLGSMATGMLQHQKPNLTKKAPLDSPKEASPAQISKFNHMANTLDNPLSIFHEIKKGTLTQSHMDILQQVYPNLLSAIKSKVMENLAGKHDEPMSYGMKMGLSKLFGQPMESNLSNLAKNQQVLAGIAGAQVAKEQAQTKPSKSGISKMKFVQGEQTKAQQSQQRNL